MRKIIEDLGLEESKGIIKGQNLVFKDANGVLTELFIPVAKTLKKDESAKFVPVGGKFIAISKESKDIYYFCENKCEYGENNGCTTTLPLIDYNKEVWNTITQGNKCINNMYPTIKNRKLEKLKCKKKKAQW